VRRYPVGFFGVPLFEDATREMKEVAVETGFDFIVAHIAYELIDGSAG
jgi:hypothetical protein